MWIIVQQMAKRNKKEQKGAASEPCEDHECQAVSWVMIMWIILITETNLIGTKTFSRCMYNYSNKQSYYRPPLPSLTHSSIKFNLDSSFTQGITTGVQFSSQMCLKARKQSLEWTDQFILHRIIDWKYKYKLASESKRCFLAASWPKPAFSCRSEERIQKREQEWVGITPRYS